MKEPGWILSKSNSVRHCFVGNRAVPLSHSPGTLPTTQGQSGRSCGRTYKSCGFTSHWPMCSKTMTLKSIAGCLRRTGVWRQPRNASGASALLGQSGQSPLRCVAPLPDDGFQDSLIRNARAWTCHQICPACRRSGRRVEGRAPYLDGVEDPDGRCTLGTRSAEAGHAGHAKKDRARIWRLGASRGTQAKA